MSLIIFLVLFIVINIFLMKWARLQLEGQNIYSTYFVRKDVRGILGKIEAPSSLEEKRVKLKKENSRF